MRNPDKGIRTHLGRGEVLEALEPLDLTKLSTMSDLVQAMSLSAFGGRQLGEAALYGR